MRKGNEKLDSWPVEQIRKLRGVHPQKELAYMFGVHPSTISRILSGSRHPENGRKCTKCGQELKESSNDQGRY